MTAAVIEGTDGLLELIWPDDADTVPITRGDLQRLIDAINDMRRLARPAPPPAAPVVDPDQLTIYDEATGQPLAGFHQLDRGDQ